MIVAQIAFLRRRPIEPEHHKHNTRSYDETHGGLLRRPRSQNEGPSDRFPPESGTRPITSTKFGVVSSVCRPHRIDHWARSYQTPRRPRQRALSKAARNLRMSNGGSPILGTRRREFITLLGGAAAAWARPSSKALLAREAGRWPLKGNGPGRALSK